MTKALKGILAVAASAAIAIPLTAAIDRSDAEATNADVRAAYAQAEQAVRALKAMEHAEDKFIVPCMRSQGFKFFPVPENRSPEGIAESGAKQGAYLASLSEQERAEYDRAFGHDNPEGCLAEAQRKVASTLPPGFQDTAMDVQMVAAQVGVAGASLDGESVGRKFDAMLPKAEVALDAPGLVDGGTSD